MDATEDEILPLVVDLDGTLLRTDTLMETANAFVVEHPLRCLAPLVWLVNRGKAGMKSALAASQPIDAATLPYHRGVLAWLQQQRSAGRSLVLATAADVSVAQQIAAHLGLFDEVLASRDSVNLKGPAKAEALVQRFGDRGFDYVGNAYADLAVWRVSRQAWLVDPPPGLEQRARRVADVGGVLKRSAVKPAERWFECLRVDQWLKNLLVFVPLVAAHGLLWAPQLRNTILAFVSLSLCGSGLHILEDLSELGADRRHPVKRTRAFASGDLSIASGWTAAFLLVLVSFASSAWLLPSSFLAVLGAFCVLTLAYSMRLRRVMMLDVVVLAMLYTIRLLAGSQAAAVPISFWLLTLSMFVFMSLALTKRYGDLLVSDESSGPVSEIARSYAVSDLSMLASLGAAASYISVMVLALYIQDPGTAHLYAHPERIWLACPLLLFWTSRVWVMAHRGMLSQDPVVYALTDKVSLVVGALFVVVFAVLAA